MHIASFEPALRCREACGLSELRRASSLDRGPHRGRMWTTLVKLVWSNGYDVRLTRERFRVRSSVPVFYFCFCAARRRIHTYLQGSVYGE